MQCVRKVATKQTLGRQNGLVGEGLAAKPGHLSWVTRVHTVCGQNRLPQVSLSRMPTLL